MVRTFACKLKGEISLVELREPPPVPFSLIKSEEIQTETADLKRQKVKTVVRVLRTACALPPEFKYKAAQQQLHLKQGVISWP